MARFDRHEELPLDPDAAALGSTDRLHFRPCLLAAVALGAAVGTPTRYTIGRAWPVGATSFPFSTLVVNLSGAFILGLLLEALESRGDDSGSRRVLRLLVGTGFCGAFTTYSTFAVESDLLLRGHHFQIAASYAVASVLGGLIATSLGIALAGKQHRRRRARFLINSNAKQWNGR